MDRSVTEDIRVGIQQFPYIWLFFTDKPSPPRNLAGVEIDKEQITVTWEPSEDDGGEPITAYTVERRNVDKQTWIKVCMIFRVLCEAHVVHKNFTIKILVAIFVISSEL